LIAKNYLKTEGLLDIIMLIPWNLIVHFKGSHYLFAIKCLRLRMAFSILDVKKFFHQVKSINELKRAQVLKDENKRNDML